tara:strand:+ start:87 stop:536 length:450 start_codon:yes stop_codon:yes gene_type:complete
VTDKQHVASQEIVDNFELFDSWEDRYRYIIELGSGLESLDPQHRVESNRVQGCVSNVWLIREHAESSDEVHFRADSDSQLVKGLIAIALRVYSDHTPRQIIDFDINGLFQDLELGQHLSRSRSNGLHSMVQRIKTLAIEHEAASGRTPE